MSGLVLVTGGHAASAPRPRDWLRPAVTGAILDVSGKR